MLDSSAEDFAAGVDDYRMAFDFPSYPLSQTKHEIFIHEESDSIGDVVLGFSLVSAVSIIDHWK